MDSFADRRAAVIAGDHTVKYSRTLPSRRFGPQPMFPLDPRDQGAKPAPDWKSRLKRGLALTGERLKKVAVLFKSHPKIDDSLYEELEDRLLAADVGVHASAHLIESLRRAVREKRLEDASQLEAELRSALVALLLPLEEAPRGEWPKPFVILLAGVNGAGKTTTIGKLTRLFQSQGKTILLAAGDTFRAAAREQLVVWGKRHGVTVVAQDGGDSAAVIYDAIQSARAKGIDVVLADTAGRLPTQLNLMEEIRKVKRVIAKADETAPHEVWLVLDANTGQNAVQQVKAFDAALGLTGLIVTKLDGTAKGGAVAAIAREHPVAIRFIGIGEKPDDLRPFIATEFVEALFA
jgi:fused signal recognition particle receptor